MIPWDTFVEEQTRLAKYPNSQLVDVECPTCGNPLFMRTDIVLTSYPVQRKFECHNCDFTGASYVVNKEYL